MPSKQSWQYYWGNYADLRTGRNFLPSSNIGFFPDCTEQTRTACASVSVSHILLLFWCPPMVAWLYYYLWLKNLSWKSCAPGVIPKCTRSSSSGWTRALSPDQRPAPRISHSWYPELAVQGRSYSQVLTTIPNHCQQSTSAAWALSPPGQHNYLIPTADCKN